MPYSAVNPITYAKKAVKWVKDEAEEASYSRIDDFILSWFDTITPEELRDALVSDTDPTIVLLNEDFKADIWRRVPFFADNTIYKAASEERIRYYIMQRIPEKLVVEYPAMRPYWEAIKPQQEKAIKATRAVLKELFD